MWKVILSWKLKISQCILKCINKYMCCRTCVLQMYSRRVGIQALTKDYKRSNRSINSKRIIFAKNNISRTQHHPVFIMGILKVFLYTVVMFYFISYANPVYGYHSEDKSTTPFSTNSDVNAPAGKPNIVSIILIN